MDIRVDPEQRTITLYTKHDIPEGSVGRPGECEHVLTVEGALSLINTLNLAIRSLPSVKVTKESTLSFKQGRFG